MVALTWAIFGQTLRHDFVNYDDDTYVYKNPKVSAGISLSVSSIAWVFTHFHSTNWHPLTTMSHMLDCQWFGLRAGRHHFVNVLLHSMTVLALFLVLLNTTGAIWRAAFVAAIFAIHPLHVESVAWISERKDVLSGLFFWLTLAAYVRYARAPSLPRYLPVLLLLALGLMSKPILVTLPVVLLLIDFWPLGRFKTVSRTKLFFEKIPLLLVSAFSAYATILAQKDSINLTLELPIATRAANALVSYLTYLWQMFWPVRLVPFYPHPGEQLAMSQIAIAAGVIGAITILTLSLRNRCPYLFTGWFWYLIMLVPVLGIIQVGLQAHADRYTYLSQIGPCILLTWSFSDALGSSALGRRLLTVAGVAVIAALGWLAWIQTSFWRNSETLWTHTLAVSGNNSIAHAGLGDVLLDRGQVDEAINEFRAALHLQPKSAYAENNLGAALLRKGVANEAIEHLESALRLDPNHLMAHFHLGNAYLQKGEYEKAIAEYQEQLTTHPEYAAARCNLGTAFLRNGDLKRAIAQFEKTVATWPDHAEAHYNLGNCYLQIGQGDRAVEQYQAALKFWPGTAKIHNNLAIVLAQKRQLNGAIAHWQQALQIEPDNLDALNNLAWMLATANERALRDGATALRLAQRAQQLSRHSNPKTLRTLAAAHAETGDFARAAETTLNAIDRARAQGDSALADSLQTDLMLYETNLPFRGPNE